MQGRLDPQSAGGSAPGALPAVKPPPVRCPKLSDDAYYLSYHRNDIMYAVAITLMLSTVLDGYIQNRWTELLSKPLFLIVSVQILRFIRSELPPGYLAHCFDWVLQPRYLYVQRDPETQPMILDVSPDDTEAS